MLFSFSLLLVLPVLRGTTGGVSYKIRGTTVGVVFSIKGMTVGVTFSLGGTTVGVGIGFRGTMVGIVIRGGLGSGPGVIDRKAHFMCGAESIQRQLNFPVPRGKNT